MASDFSQKSSVEFPAKMSNDEQLVWKGKLLRWIVRKNISNFDDLQEFDGRIEGDIDNIDEEDGATFTLDNKSTDKHLVFKFVEDRETVNHRIQKSSLKKMIRAEASGKQRYKRSELKNDERVQNKARKAERNKHRQIY